MSLTYCNNPYYFLLQIIPTVAIPIDISYSKVGLDGCGRLKYKEEG